MLWQRSDERTIRPRREQLRFGGFRIEALALHAGVVDALKKARKKIRHDLQDEQEGKHEMLRLLRPQRPRRREELSDSG